MVLKKWDRLPLELRNEEVRIYYDILKKKRLTLICKRLFDIAASLFLLILLSPVFLVLAIAIKADSRGPVFFRQIRVTQYNRRFRIFKFRSMTVNTEKESQITVKGDARVTKVGAFIRRCRLDEISQLLNVLRGEMTFVGTRPEVPRYTERYTPEMMATLLLPAGITSLASILYKDEARLLDCAENADAVYTETVLPAKMRYNLEQLKKTSLRNDLRVMVMTVLAVLGKDFGEKSDKTAEKKRK